MRIIIKRLYLGNIWRCRYAKWIKPDSKGQISYNPIYMTFLQRQNYKVRKQISSCQELRGWEIWLGDRVFLYLDCGGSCTIVYICQHLQNWTLEGVNFAIYKLCFNLTEKKLYHLEIINNYVNVKNAEVMYGKFSTVSLYSFSTFGNPPECHFS